MGGRGSYACQVDVSSFENVEQIKPKIQIEAQVCFDFFENLNGNQIHIQVQARAFAFAAGFASAEPFPSVFVPPADSKRASRCARLHSVRLPPDFKLLFLRFRADPLPSSAAASTPS